MPTDGGSTTDFEDEVQDALIGDDDDEEEVPDKEDKEEE